ncbi:hypothetical protein KVR01_009160 [Diaporthe batatas]|uniref:uncharacterized protein n=1 Tax=Diaporthe batatas TaxID=748121 RepID=UPI001D0527B6|nr:uncharacterized protein KVR01_009160 [Diaporthe batatas]KAG8160896.1 hypothetical protein KVR01_009160 [Diaporthe batatas]
MASLWPASSVLFQHCRLAVLPSYGLAPSLVIPLSRSFPRVAPNQPAQALLQPSTTSKAQTLLLSTFHETGRTSASEMTNNNIFRMFNPQAPKVDRVEKRRAQVRQAQQTYRERKEAYTKALETELARSKAREAELLRENERLRDTVRKLSGRLEQLGGGGSGLGGDDVGGGDAAEPAPREAVTRTMADNMSSMAPPLARLGDIDPVGLGVDFVLALEKPCLEHLHGDPDRPDEPSGHALTLSAQACAVSCPEVTTSPVAREAIDPHAMPAAMLENLLALSADVLPPAGGSGGGGGDDDRITPVQAWNLIRSQPHFGGFELEGLRTLAVVLRDVVKCHGFGAVLPQSVFKRLLFEFLLKGRPL